MPRRSIRHLIASLLILAVAVLASFGSARPASAATYVISVDPGYIYLNVAPGATAEATFKVATAAEQSVFAHANAGWLTLDDDSWFGSRTVKLTASARGMAPGDVQVARIQLSSYPTDVSVAVVLAVNGPSTPPPVAISPARVDFGTLIPGQYAISYHSLALSTAADVTITTDADWIDVRPVSAKGVTTALISVVPVTPKMNGFKEYIGTIEVRAGSAAPVQIPVTARLASPEAPVTETTAPASSEAPFTDVPADAWVATARANGLIGGFPDRTFRPRDPVTRAQIAVLLQRASLICGVSTEPGCAAPMGRADQTLAGATLGGPRSQAESALGIATEERSGYANSYTTIYDDGHVTVQYVTPSDTVWSVRVVGEGATPRGIKIGDTVEAVRKAYGPQGELKNGVLTYRTGADFDFFYIQFFIVEGKVHSILLTQSK